MIGPLTHKRCIYQGFPPELRVVGNQISQQGWTMPPSRTRIPKATVYAVYAMAMIQNRLQTGKCLHKVDCFGWHNPGLHTN